MDHYLNGYLSLVYAWHQYPQVPFLLGTDQPHLPQPITLQGIIVAKVQDSALGLIKPHPIGPCPSVQLFQVFLQSPSSFQQIDTCSQLSVICKFTNERLHTFIHVVNKNIKPNCPQHRSLRDTTGDWLPAACSTVHRHSLGPAIQPVPNPAKRAPVEATSCQLILERAVGHSVKGLAEVQIDNIHSLPCIHQAGHLVIKGDQVLRSDWSVVTMILLCTLFVNGCHIGQLPVVWNLTSEPGLLVDDGEWLNKLICQLPHHPGMDPIWSHRFMDIQAFQQFSDCLLSDNEGTTLLPDIIYQPRRQLS
ncbi:hypothetical protein DUI87_22316 [Hirundo rustica rustica]|uniref:Uncharacterized protein n=1 Tax=Hirundo rustica rustica TaxID=333673 RepID=A0A3M0JIV4_HIRRU|nr:hypothetical protein DUI87_22316 [Hirundo rustica rustica]